MTAATLPDGYTLTDDAPDVPGHRYALHRAGELVGRVYRESDGTYTAHGWHYLHRLPWHGAGADSRTPDLIADTPAGAAAMLARLADILARTADSLAPYRDTAAAWHGGQSSALYALASSGTVTDPARLARELDACRRDAWGSTDPDVAHDLPDLAAMLDLATLAAEQLDSLTDGAPA